MKQINCLKEIVMITIILFLISLIFNVFISCFVDIINLSLLDSLLEHCCVLLVSKSREIVKSALSFLQVLLSSFPDYQLGCHLDRLVSSKLLQAVLGFFFNTILNKIKQLCSLFWSQYEVARESLGKFYSICYICSPAKCIMAILVLTYFFLCICIWHPTRSHLKQNKSTP